MGSLVCVDLKIKDIFPKGFPSNVSVSCLVPKLPERMELDHVSVNHLTEDPSAPYILQINNAYSSLVARIMPPPHTKDIHAFNPRTCEYVTLHHNRGFPHIIQLRILGWGDYLGLLRWVQYSTKL